jgi:hypothetical protein
MNRDDIIRMAREAGLAGVTVCIDEEMGDILSPDIEFFAELIAKHILAKSYPELVSLAAKHAAETVAAAEREACAALCDKISDEDGFEGGYADRCAFAIRERGAP